MNTSKVVIRPEVPTDRPAIAEVNRRAFGRDNEARLVEALRQAGDFDPRLSLVAEYEGTVVGHILFSVVHIEQDGGQTRALSLAPMAVVPEHQRRGVGSALVPSGLQACRRTPYGLVVVVGHPEFYPRFGFMRADAIGLRAPFAVAPEAFMVFELRQGALTGAGGILRYPDTFKLAE